MGSGSGEREWGGGGGVLNYTAIEGRVRQPVTFFFQLAAPPPNTCAVRETNLRSFVMLFCNL